VHAGEFGYECLLLNFDCPHPAHAIQHHLQRLDSREIRYQVVRSE
jgi:hypothetical protein